MRLYSVLIAFLMVFAVHSSVTANTVETVTYVRAGRTLTTPVDLTTLFHHLSSVYAPL